MTLVQSAKAEESVRESNRHGIATRSLVRSPLIAAATRPTRRGELGPPPATRRPEPAASTPTPAPPRPSFLGLVVPLVWRLAFLAGDRPAGDCHRLAPAGVPPLLAVEVARRPTRSACRLSRSPAAHPP